MVASQHGLTSDGQIIVIIVIIWSGEWRPMCEVGPVMSLAQLGLAQVLQHNITGQHTGRHQDLKLVLSRKTSQ